VNEVKEYIKTRIHVTGDTEYYSNITGAREKRNEA
jgi:hypothetical protein